MGSAFLAVGGVFSSSLSLPLCLYVSFFFGEGVGGKEVEVPRLDGRTLHFGAGKCRLGAGLGGRVKAEKPSSCHSPFRLDVAG